jgi:hypothetical protein
VADAVIPLPTDFTGPAVWPNDLFLFAGIATVPCAVVLEIACFEVMEPANLGELNMLDFSGVASDGFIQVNDLEV